MSETLVPCPSDPALGALTRSQWDEYLAQQLGEHRAGLVFVPAPVDANAGRAARHMTVADLEVLAGPKSRPMLDDVLGTVPSGAACTSLADFNYAYDDEGVLRNRANGHRFHFVSQRHYEALGDLVLPAVQHAMVTKHRLRRIPIPIVKAPDAAGASAADAATAGVVDGSASGAGAGAGVGAGAGASGDATRSAEAKAGVSAKTGASSGAAAVGESYIFASEDLTTNTDTLLILLQGSGAVRPGQWARAVCINDSLRTGSVLPYLEKAQESGWATLVLNPNQNFAEPYTPSADAAAGKPRSYFCTKDKSPVEGKDKSRPVPGSETPRAHVVYVWDNFVRRSPARNVLIVAHSAGGAGTLHLFRERTGEAVGRCRGVAFTDAVHWFLDGDSAVMRDFFRAHCVDWVASADPLDTPQVPLRDADMMDIDMDAPVTDPIRCVSAGHTRHEYTSGIAIDSVFKFLRAKAAATA